MQWKLLLPASVAVLIFAGAARAQQAQSQYDSLNEVAVAQHDAVVNGIKAEQQVLQSDAKSLAPAADAHMADFTAAYLAVKPAQDALNNAEAAAQAAKANLQKTIDNAPQAIKDQATIIGNRQSELDAAQKFRLKRKSH